MRHAFRKVAVTGTTLITAVMAVLAIGIAARPAPAKATASCLNAFCAGLDPFSEACPVTHTVTRSDAYVTLYNEYSGDGVDGACYANWAEASLSGLSLVDGYSMVVYITTTDSAGHLESMCYPGPSNTGSLNEYCYDYNYSGSATVWTDMVDGSNVTDAYVNVYDASGSLVDELSASQ